MYAYATCQRGRIATLVLLFGALLVTPFHGQTCRDYLRTSKAISSETTIQTPADAESSRLCLHSFPWPDHEGNPLETVSASEIRSVREKIVAMNGMASQLRAQVVNLGERDRKLAAAGMFPTDTSKFIYAYRIMEGVDLEQAELAATFYHVRRLIADGQFQTALTDLEESQRNPRLAKLWTTPPERMSRLDAGDENTYFRKETLIGLLKIYEILAKTEVSVEPKQAIALFASLESLPLAAGLGDFVPQTNQLRTTLSRKAAVAISELHDLPAWDRLNDANDALGIGLTEMGIDIFFDLKDEVGPRIVRLQKDSRRAELVTGEKVLQSFDENVTENLRTYSTDSVRLCNVLKQEDGGYRLELKDQTFSLSPADIALLEGREPLPTDHKLHSLLAEQDAALVVFSHPLMQRPGRYLAEAEELSFLLQASYPHARIYRDDLTPSTIAKAEKLRGLTSPLTQDLVVLTADDSFSVDDRNLIADLSTELRANGVPVVSYKPGLQRVETGGKVLVVITGHIDQNLARFVRELGEQGWFRGAHVVFNSCYSELSTELVAEINGRFEAVGTYRFQGRIQPDKVGEALLDLVEELRRPVPDLDFGKILNRTTSAQGLKGLWVICNLENEEEKWPT